MSDLVALLFLIPPICIAAVWLFAQARGIRPPHRDVSQLLGVGEVVLAAGRTKRASACFDAALEISKRDPQVVARVSDARSGHGAKTSEKDQPDS